MPTEFRLYISSALLPLLGSATPKINVKQSGRLVVVLIVLNGSNTLALTNPRDRCSCCSELRSKVECALNRFKSPEPGEFKACCCLTVKR